MASHVHFKLLHLSKSIGINLKSAFVILLLLEISNAYAKEVVTMGALVFPPETIVDGLDGFCKGEAVNVTQRIFENSNYKLDIVCTGAARIYRMFNAGEVDLTINIKSTAAIQSVGTFLEPNYHKLVLNLYQRQGNGEPKVASVIRGFDYHGFKQLLKENGYQFVHVPSPIDSIRLFHLGRTNSLLSYQSTFDNYFLDNDNKPIDNFVVNHLVDVKNYYVVSKKSPKHDEIVILIKQFAEINGVTSFKSNTLSAR